MVEAVDQQMFLVFLLKMRRDIERENQPHQNLNRSERYDTSRDARKVAFWCPTRSHTNQDVQSHKKAGSLKVWSQQEEGLYHLSSKN